MRIQTPFLTRSRIFHWMQEAAETSPRSLHSKPFGVRSAPGLDCSGFSLGKAESEVRRAQAKSYVRAIKPLRRLLRNQGAVNDSIIIALSELIDVTEKMARRVELLDIYFGAMKKQVRQIDSKEAATLGGIEHLDNHYCRLEERLSALETRVGSGCDRDKPCE